MRLRRSLLLLCVAAALPITAFAVLAAAWVVNQENEGLVRAAKERNRAIIGAVEAEVRGTISALNTLTVTRSLVASDLQGFHEDAAAALKTQTSWNNVLLTDVSGRELVNARLPWGAVLAAAPVAPRSFEAAIATGRPAVDDLALAPKLDNEAGLPVRVPVFRDGKVVYILTGVLRPQTFQTLLVDQRLPERWVSGLVDGSGRVVARVPAVATGTTASEGYLKQTRAADEGWYRGETIDGHDTFTAFLRSPLTGWTIGYALPAEVVLAGVKRAAWMLGAGIVSSIFAAVVIGLWLGRLVAGPMGELARAAAALPEGGQAPVIDSHIDEVKSLAQALDKAVRSIQSRDRTLRQLADDLLLANTKKSEFLALLAHELRNPLAPLRTGVAMITMQRDPHRLAEVQAMMERQVSHMARLIEDLIDVSRIDRGQLELRREAVAVDSLVAVAIETAKPNIESRQQQLVVRYAPVALWVDGDPVRLSQVISNLLNNASKFTPSHGSIEVVTRTEGAHVVVEVSDTGVGFSPEDGERIFDLFVQLDPNLSRKASGLGIGLSLVRTIVELHGGTVEARSQGVGSGARFTVRLPAAAASVRSAELTRSPMPVGTTRVLVVDDNRDAATSLAEVLRLHGFDARAALDGDEALSVARAFHPGVAFVDLNMPGMSGVELARRLKAESWAEGLRLAALTGMARPSDIEDTRQAGFDAHFSKPISIAKAIGFALQSSDNVVQLRRGAGQGET